MDLQVEGKTLCVESKQKKVKKSRKNSFCLSRIRQIEFDAMQDEQLKGFVDAVANSIEIQQELLRAENVDAIIEIAKNNGFEITATDLIRHQASETLQLSDEELTVIAGGLSDKAKMGLVGAGTALGGAGWALAGLVIYGLIK